MYPFHIVHKLQCTIPDSLGLDSQFLGTTKLCFAKTAFVVKKKIIRKRRKHNRSITLLRINHFSVFLRYFVHYDYCIILSFDSQTKKKLRPRSSGMPIHVVHVKPYMCALQHNQNVLASYRNHSQIECDGIVQKMCMCLCSPPSLLTFRTRTEYEIG